MRGADARAACGRRKKSQHNAKGARFSTRFEYSEKTYLCAAFRGRWLERQPQQQTSSGATRAKRNQRTPGRRRPASRARRVSAPTLTAPAGKRDRVAAVDRCVDRLRHCLAAGCGDRRKQTLPQVGQFALWHLALDLQSHQEKNTAVNPLLIHSSSGLAICRAPRRAPRPAYRQRRRWFVLFEPFSWIIRFYVK